jgi:magnesium chelatase family protein
MAARQRALQRAGRPNALLTPTLIKRDCALSEDGDKLLEQAIDKLGLSHRAYHRILKLGRTIADLEGVEDIGIPHLSEAIGYRRLDRSAPNSRI